MEQQTIDEKIENFLKKNENSFKVGVPVSDEELEKIIKQVGLAENCVTISQLPKDYRQFLNKYGSIDGESITIGESTRRIGDDRINYLASMQRTFKHGCESDHMSKNQLRCCWRIAGIEQIFIGDHSIDYYVNVSKIGRGFIYSRKFHDGHKLYAYNFAEFLDKLFEDYSRRTVNNAYRKNIMRAKSRLE